MAGELRGIVDLQELVQKLQPAQRQLFERIFRVDTTEGELRAPPSMYGWVRKHFGALEAVEKQRVVKVTNLITVEGSLFNPLRAMRPTECQSSFDLAEAIASSRGDSFCHPLTETTEDRFGRIRGKHSVTASNIAMCDGFHGVLVFQEHHPLAFSAEAVKDYVDTALAWARRAHCEDKSARYFFFLWNCLWKSGASMLHGHAQMTLGRGIHYARVEHWRRAALLYRIGHGVNYFDDLFAAHQAVGLAFEHSGVRVLASLTPVKEKEVLLIADRPHDDLKHAIYTVLRSFVDHLNVASFNLALYMKPIDSVPEDWRGFPAVVRIVDRGDPACRTCDVGAMDLYGSSVVSSNPFEVADGLRLAFRMEA